MELLTRLERYSKERADVVAFKNAFTDETITYSELWQESEKIAYAIDGCVDTDKKPVVVYGHKSPLMLATFLACVKTGHPYCPVDISMPQDRLKDIVEASETELLFALEPTEVTANHVIDMEDLEEIVSDESVNANISSDRYVSGDDVYYIIFTSGSTGKPIIREISHILIRLHSHLICQ